MISILQFITSVIIPSAEYGIRVPSIPICEATEIEDDCCSVAFEVEFDD